MPALSSFPEAYANSLSGSDLSMNVAFAKEENQSIQRKTLGGRLTSRNLTPIESKPRSQVVKVGGAIDDHYANLTSLIAKFMKIPIIMTHFHDIIQSYY